MIWCRATGGTDRKSAKVTTAPARKTTKIGVPSTSSATGRTASVQIMRAPPAHAPVHAQVPRRRWPTAAQPRWSCRQAPPPGEMRYRHGNAERHAGLPDRGEAADEGPALHGRERTRGHHGAVLNDGEHEPRPRAEAAGEKVERDVAALRGDEDQADHHQPDHHEHEDFVGAGEHHAEDIAADRVDHVDRHHDEQCDTEQRPRRRHGDTRDARGRGRRHGRFRLHGHGMLPPRQVRSALQPIRSAPSPRPSRGEGWGEGWCCCARLPLQIGTPTPNPSPAGCGLARFRQGNT